MLNVIDVRDVAEALLAAIEARRYSEPLLTTAHAVSTEELYALVCRMGGVPMPRLSSSTNFAMFTSYLTELLYSAMGQQTPIISAGMMMATAIDYLDRPSALSETGIAPRPLGETIRDAITLVSRDRILLASSWIERRLRRDEIFSDLPPSDVGGNTLHETLHKERVHRIYYLYHLLAHRILSGHDQTQGFYQRRVGIVEQMNADAGGKEVGQGLGKAPPKKHGGLVVGLGRIVGVANLLESQGEEVNRGATKLP